MHHKGPLIRYRQLTIQKRWLFNPLTSEVTRRPAMKMNDIQRRKMDVWNYGVPNMGYAARLQTPDVGGKKRTTESNGSVHSVISIREKLLINPSSISKCVYIM